MNLCVYIYIFFAMIDTTSKITLSNILIKGLLYCFTLLSLSAKDARSKHLIVGAGAQSTYLYIIWHCEGHVPWIVHMLLIILKWIWTIAYDSQFDMYIYIYDSMRIGIDASHIRFSRGHGLFGPIQCSPSIGGAKEEPNKTCGVWGIANWGCSLSIWKPALGRCRHWWWEVCERFGFWGH